MDLRYKKYVGKTTFFFAIFLHKIIPFTISKLDYRFVIGKKQYAKVEFEAILTNKSKIKLFAYDKIADYIYKNEPRTFWVMGKIRDNMNVEITELIK